MNPYRGIIRMTCEQESCDIVAGNDVRPECINCEATVTIVDHDGKALAQATMFKEIKEQGLRATESEGTGKISESLNPKPLNSELKKRR